MTVAINAAGQTHVGLVRSRNEDCFYVGERLLAVADGLGGHVAGDVASETVINTLVRWYLPVEPTGLTDVLGRAIYAANQAVRIRAEADPSLLGMGTTLVAMLVSGSTAVLANVGDSRAYIR